MDIPTFEINENELENLINFISKHEDLLKEFGAIKIQPNNKCKLALFKREKKFDINLINEEIIKINDNDLIYYVNESEKIDKSNIKKANFIKDESSFWSLLSSSKTTKQELNISILEDKSFFSQKTSRSYFDIHRLPNQSILKLAGRKYLNQFVPYVKRAHGPASIYPLNSIEQNLFSLNYHHEGGHQYYYFIPANQKHILEKIIKQYNPSTCLDHGKIFINPLLLDKYNIKYYKTIQKPNQFIVLASGSLSQSFTTHSNCTESIDFALPSWILDGYAENSFPTCQCNIHLNYSTELLDLNLFTHESIQNYLTLQINYIIEHQLSALKDNDYMDIDMDLDRDFDDLPTPNSNETNSFHGESMISTIMKLTTPYKPIVSSCQLSPRSLITSSVNGSYPDEDKFDDKYFSNKHKIFKNENCFDASNEKTSNTSMINSYLNDDLFQTNEYDKSLLIYENIDENLSNNCDDDDDLFITYEELMDFLPTTKDNNQTTFKQDYQNINENCSLYSSEKVNQIKEKQLMNNRRALFVTGLKSDVNTNDLRKHFLGCIKVTMKTARSSSHLKYAFILHRTSEDAQRNIQRPIDHYLLGNQCHVEYATDHSDISNHQQIYDQNKIVVTQIPFNINQNNLSHLFPNGHIIRYSPARYSNTSTLNKNDNKLILGYAFIQYDSEQQATYVIQHANQYQINGQQLTISLYRHRIPTHGTSNN